MTKVILIIPNSTLHQQMTVKNLFPPSRAAWWHWSSEVFLISMQHEDRTALQIRDEIQQVLPGLYMLVFKVELKGEWAGWGPMEWQTWFNQFWP
jgi:hypothetical protein